MISTESESAMWLTDQISACSGKQNMRKVKSFKHEKIAVLNLLNSKVIV